MLSGYQGSPEIADVIVDAVAQVKAANPTATYTCDPVMGNATSGCFVNPAIPPKYRSTVIPVADVLTPNQFELGFITDRDALLPMEEGVEDLRAQTPLGREGEFAVLGVEEVEDDRVGSQVLVE